MSIINGHIKYILEPFKAFMSYISNMNKEQKYFLYVKFILIQRVNARKNPGVKKKSSI